MYIYIICHYDYFRECIIRVCEAAGLRSADRKRKMDRRLHRVLADKPIMTHAGMNMISNIYIQKQLEFTETVHPLAICIINHT